MIHQLDRRELELTGNKTFLDMADFFLADSIRLFGSPQSPPFVGRRSALNSELCCHRVRRGFTLLELMVVISIIALLVAMLVPSLAKAKQRAVETVCQTRIRALGEGDVGVFGGV